MYLSTKIYTSLALCLSTSSAFTWDVVNNAQSTEVSSAENESFHQKSNATSMEPMFFKDMGSKRVSIRYGPYKIPSSTTMAGMAVYFDAVAQKPCDDCLITWMKANLIYPDGRVANTDTGMWLHHAVALNRGRNDSVCGEKQNSPQRFFASGNERTALDLTLSGTSKTGYWLKQNDKMAFVVELMNEMAESREAVLVIEYEYMPSMPKDFKELDSLWLDVGGCMNSEIMPTSAATSEYTMKDPFKTKTAGKILGVGSHMHDGGVRIEVVQNSKTICNSKAVYGENSNYISPNGAKVPGMDMPGMQHISSISSCYSPQTGTYAAGDEISIKAYYDYKLHPGMMENNSSAPIMGIAVMYIEAEAPDGSSSSTKEPSPVSTASSMEPSPVSTAGVTSSSPASIVGSTGPSPLSTAASMEPSLAPTVVSVNPSLTPTPTIAPKLPGGEGGEAGQEGRGDQGSETHGSGGETGGMSSMEGDGMKSIAADPIKLFWWSSILSIIASLFITY